MAGARAGSAPPGPRSKGAPDPTRSQSAGGAGLPPPRLRPLFLWVRQQDTAVVQVHCEDYDPRNRLRLTRTPLGWRVLPRTDTFDAIKLPLAPPPAPARRARPARRSRARRRTALTTLPALPALPALPSAIDLPPPSPAARATPSHSPEPDPTRPRLTDSEEGSHLTTGSGQEEDNSPDRRSEVDPESSKDNNSRSAWNLPDIEISIPSHTIHIPQRLERQRQERSVSPRDTSLPERDFNPTPLDKLLAVAELEFNQQQTASPELEEPSPDSSLHRQFTKFPFLSEDESDRDIVAFDNIPDTVQNVENDEGFFSQKPSENKIIDDEGVFQSGIAAKDLFESITESHYMPVDLDNHDHETINANELLDSLVEKGCEDHNIIGNDFDKIAHIVSSNGDNHIEGDYDEDDEEMLMDDAPVSDIIHRLEQSLDSPGTNSMSAAQGLLHLQQMTDDLAEAHLMGNVEGNLAYSEEAFDKSHEPLSEISQLNEEMNTPIDDHEQESIHDRKAEAEEELDEVIEEQQLSNNPTIQDEIQSEMENENNENVESEDYSSGEQASESDSIHATSLVKEREDDEQISNKCEITLEKEENHDSSDDNMMPTDLSINTIAKGSMDNVDDANDDLSNKSDEMPKDLSCRKRPASPCPSPQRVYTSRPVSRGSDTVQSPQPSGIPAVPPSPELFPTPHSRSNSKSMFLETLLASPSPKMCFSSELTITKHQNEPLNLGKSRKSASPTVSSCSEEVKKTKTFGEPEEKRSRKEIPDEAPLQKLNKLFSKTNEIALENKPKKADSRVQRSLMDLSSVEQLQLLRCSTEFDIPDPLLVPKDRFSAILASPAREIPALLLQRPELRLPEAFAYPAVLQDPDILVVSLSQLEGILLKHRHALEKEKQRELKELRDKEHKDHKEFREHRDKVEQREHKEQREYKEQREHREAKEHREHKEHKQTKPTTPLGLPEISRVHSTAPITPTTPTTPKSTSISSLPMAPTTPTTPLLPSALIPPILPPIAESPLRSMAGMGAGPAAEAMAGDIEAATSAAFNQMIWLPYLSQFEAAMACSQNSDILKALNSTAVPPGYPTQAGYPDLSQMFSQQQRFMNTSQFPGMPPIDYSNQLELAMWQEVASQPNGSNFQRLKSAETQNLFAQAAKLQHHHQQQARGHSARTSPITRGWRGAAGAAAGTGLPPNGLSGVLPPFPWAGYPARAPHPSQYSPGARSRHHQPPPSPSAYYQNNNYMSSAKAPREIRGQAHAPPATPHQGEQRPRITVKSLQNLLEPPEVGSSTHPPEELPHDPQTPLWHPLFGK